MPGWTKLAAAANIGQDIDAAALQPKLADVMPNSRAFRRPGSRRRRLIRWVGAIVLNILAADYEIGDLRPILRNRG